MGEILRCASGFFPPSETSENKNYVRGNGSEGNGNKGGEFISYLPVTAETIALAIKGEVTVRGRNNVNGVEVFVVATSKLPYEQEM